MGLETSDIVIAFIGSGGIAGIILWAVKKIKQSGVGIVRQEALEFAIKQLEKKQDVTDTVVQEQGRKLERLDHNIDVRLTAIETELVAMKQLQLMQNEAMNETSKDIKSLMQRQYSKEH